MFFIGFILVQKSQTQIHVYPVVKTLILYALWYQNTSIPHA